MSHPASPQFQEWINRAREVPIEHLAAKLQLKVRRTSRAEWHGPCPVCGGTDRFFINLRKQSFYCRSCAKGGDVIALTQFVDGCNFVEACKRLSREPPPRAEPAPTQSFDPKANRDEASDRHNQRIAAEIWREIIPLAGTLGILHLEARGISPLPEGVDGSALGFHPKCHDGPERRPAIIELLRDVRTDEPRAIRRTFLTPDGVKIGKAKTLGPKIGTACKLTPNCEVTAGLVIGEGLETVLAGMLFELRPAWALGDAGELGAFPLLSGIECLTILVDNDYSGTGQRRSMQCSARWTDAGREVTRVTPFAVGADINDLIRGAA
jgi:phage/plasmid primase-like uncharacterized protein